MHSGSPEVGWGEVAITNAGMGASHAISYALSVLQSATCSIQWHVDPPCHGVQSWGVVEKFAILAQKMGISVDKLPLEKAALAGCARVAEFAQEIGIPKHLRSFGIT